MTKIILDASAIINGIAILTAGESYITSPSVIDEVQSRRGKKNLQYAFNLDMIEQRIPKADFIVKAGKIAEETKDNLSEQDLGIIALALEFSADIATDDYGIQNVAAKLGIKTMPVGEKGIRVVLHWQYYCPACKNKYSAPGICGVCGTKLKRKARK